MPVTSDFNRSLSKIFSNPTFREIAQTGNSQYFLEKLKKYNTRLSIEPGVLVKEILENAYGYLSKNYRNEYLYKNTLLNNILLGRHSVRTANMLNEFKIGNSIADIVIVNGTSTVYEIKTELDSPEKLQKQIQDYKKGFLKVFLVTHHSLSNRYLPLLKETKVGLLSLSGRFNLTELKHAEEDSSRLSNETMMRMLRKEEYSAIAKAVSGKMPDVSNIKFFSECLKIVSSVSPLDLHTFVLHQLRKRVPRESTPLESSELPKELKHICLCIDPTIKEYSNLFAFLNLNL